MIKQLTEEQALEILQKKFPTLKKLDDLLQKTVKLSDIERVDGELIFKIVGVGHQNNAIFIKLTTEKEEERSLNYYGDKKWYLGLQDGSGDHLVQEISLL